MNRSRWGSEIYRNHIECGGATFNPRGDLHFDFDQAEDGDGSQRSGSVAEAKNKATGRQLAANYYLTCWLLLRLWCFNTLSLLFRQVFFRQRQSESETAADTALGCLKLSLPVVSVVSLVAPELYNFPDLRYIRAFVAAFLRSSPRQLQTPIRVSI